MSNTLKAGFFFHQHCPESDVINSETGNTLTHDYGFYLVGDHQVYTSGRHGLCVFYQLGISPRNDNFGYLGAGCTYSGLLSKKSTDVLGLAIADGMLTKERGRGRDYLRIDLQSSDFRSDLFATRNAIRGASGWN